MTFEETRQILSILRIAYPQTYAKWTKSQREEYLSLCAKGFQDDDALDVMMAVWHYINETDREFAPTIGMIRSYINSTPRFYLTDAAKKYFPEDKRVQALIAHEQEEYKLTVDECIAEIPKVDESGGFYFNEFLAELIKRNPSASRSTAQRWLNEAGYQSDQEKGKQTGKPSVWHKKIDTNYY